MVAHIADAISTEDEVREFLGSRRSDVTPLQAGIPDFGGDRSASPASIVPEVAVGPLGCVLPLRRKPDK
jgi:hypothetical protein